jgi:CheY-like chemotaxis protein
MKTVLIVDDDAMVRFLYRRILRDVPVEVQVALSGQEALSLLRGGFCPDLIISDIDMPGMTGLTLAKFCKEEFPGIPLLLASGGAYDIEAQQMGIRYFAKGIDTLSAIRNSVNEIVDLPST